MPRVPDIIIEDGEIKFRNFSGNPDKNYNGSNTRTVTFVIPKEKKDDLLADGWNVRAYIPKSDPDAEPTYILEATIAYKTKNGVKKDPGIFIVKPTGLLHVDEDMVDTLDGKDILKVDAVLGASYWEQGNRHGIRPYVNKLYITIRENPIEEKYDRYLRNINDSMFSSDGDLPFPME